MSVDERTSDPHKDYGRRGRPHQVPPTVDPPAANGSGSPLTRVTVNLTHRSVTALDNAVEQTSDSRTDTINRALQVYELVLELLNRGDGRSLRLAYPGGDTERIYIT